MLGHQDLDAALPALNAALNALNQDGAAQPNAGLNAFNTGLIATPFGVLGIGSRFQQGPNFVTGLNGPHEGVISGPPVTLTGAPLNDLYFGKARDRKLQPPNWKRIQMPRIKKCIYQEHLNTAQRSPNEVDAYRKANGIAVGGREVPKPLPNMAETSLPEDLMAALQAMNYSSLSRLESQCWPVALSGRDLLAIVEEEPEGKTHGYLLPAIAHIRHQEPLKHRDGPIVLVLAATRESAQEIEQAVLDFANHTSLRVMCLSSGVPKRPQLEQLKKGAEICVATIGRLVAFMEDRDVNLRRCSYLVVDGADRMVAIGLEQQLRTIAKNIRPDRQTLMWTSSPSMDMERLAEEFLTDHVTVTIGASQACKNERVEQVVLVFKDDEKENALVGLLQDILLAEDDQVIVFVEMQQTVDYLVQKMHDQNWSAIGIHGRKGDMERKWTLKLFELRSVSILVTTDVAARSLKSDGVRFVVNYDRPSTPGNYAWRVKHAARTGGTGRAYTFLEPSDTWHARQIISILRETKQGIPREVFKIAKKKAPSRIRDITSGASDS
ncbi:hypothetical protein V5799_033363 [Amblyomma americanum]|uniref:RNA helicase n=1 Tax=Amblyomma americanum TaxID=6943 RepID=A0AAQ4DNI8_AMBAM